MTEPDFPPFFPRKDAGFYFTFEYEGTSKELYPETLLRRLALCFYLLTQIPDEGLDELKETMEEIRDFYVQTAEYKPKALPEPQKVKVKLNQPSVRPVFPIMPDEV